MNDASRAGAQRFSASIILPVSPAEAFAYLGDPSTAAVIDPAVISYETSTNPMDVGTINTIKVRLFGLAVPMASRVVAWDVGKRMVIESIRPASPVTAYATHTFEPHPDGTHYTWAMEFVPNAVGGRVAARFMCWFMHNNARKQQLRFRDQMAARAAATGDGRAPDAR